MDIKGQIEKELKKFNSLVECFLTIGLTPEDTNLYLNRQFDVSPVILSKFPSFYSPPDTVKMFCFPWGLKLIRSSQETFSEVFNFNVLSDEGHQLYCAALVIYESGSKTTINRTETQIKIDFEFQKSKADYYLLPVNPKPDPKRSRSAARKEKIEKPRDYSRRLEKVNTDQVMVPKCLVLMSKYPFLETLKTILIGIYKIMRSKLDLPFECYLSHLFLKVPLPPKGAFQVIYQILNTIVAIKQPPPNQLPLFDSNLAYIFHSLTTSKVLKVFLCLLLEENIVFLSSSNDKLCAVGHCFLSLLYPFRWNFVFVSVLPCQLIDFLYCPVKFVFGMSSKYKEEVITRCCNRVTIVDLDLGTVEKHDEIVYIRNRIVSEPANLPEHYGKKLAKQLSEATECLENKPKAKFDSKKTEEIRNYFFQFFVSVFLEYERFLIKGENDFTDVNSFFEVEKFLLKQKSDKEFYRRFLKTNMFAGFCKRNIKVLSHDQQMENMLFNDHITSKKNRSYFSLHKKPTSFIDDTSNNHDGRHIIPIAENCFNKKGCFFYYTFPKFDYEVLGQFGLPRSFSQKSVEYQFPNIEKNDHTISQIYPKPQLETVFHIWIDLWIACLWMQEDIEIKERVKELYTFLDLINKPENCHFGIYLKLINGCLDVDPSIALHVFSYMIKKNVLLDSYATVMLHKTLHKLFSRNNFAYVEAEQIKPKTENEQLVGYFNQKIRKRTFNIKKKNCANPQKLKINLVQKCQACGKGVIITDENLKNFCCKSLMQNMLICVVGETDCLIEVVKLHQLGTLSTIFHRYLERNSQVYLNDLRKKSEIFWNLIWQFIKASLEFKFLVPYENEIVQEKIEIFLTSEELITSDITPRDLVEQSTQTETPLILIKEN